MKRLATAILIAAAALLAATIGRAPGASPVLGVANAQDEYPWRVYIPLAMVQKAPPARVFSIPLRAPSDYFGIEGEGRYYISWGYTPQEAYEGHIGLAGIIAATKVEREFVAGNTYYNIYRGFIEVEIPEFAGEVVTAGLRLIPNAHGEASKAPIIGLYLGSWPDGVFPASVSQAGTLWTAWTPDSLVGQFDTTDIYCFGFTTCEVDPSWEPRYTVIPFDPRGIVPGERLKLVMRDMEDDKDVTVLYGGKRSFSPHWAPSSVETEEDMIWGWIEFGVQ